MSFRLEMLQVCRLAPKLLGESAELIRQFLAREQNPDGGFKDRDGRSDLYYTVFGLDSLIALQAPIPAERVSGFLREFGGGAGLDFVHLCALVRCWAALANSYRSVLPSVDTAAVANRIEEFRTEDGGYTVSGDRKFGTVYGCFLALGAYQDLKTARGMDARVDVPEQMRLLDCLSGLETPDGAWANDRHMRVGSTNATAAAVMILRHLGTQPPERTADWLLERAHPMGGFLAAPQAPIPDLLSTATALHALAGLQRDFSSLKESSLDFIDSLWTNSGSFHGHWSEETLDCEYTFYGLLALGHLSLCGNS